MEIQKDVLNSNQRQIRASARVSVPAGMKQVFVNKVAIGVRVHLFTRFSITENGSTSFDVKEWSKISEPLPIFYWLLNPSLGKASEYRLDLSALFEKHKLEPVCGPLVFRSE